MSRKSRRRILQTIGAGTILIGSTGIGTASADSPSPDAIENREDANRRTREMLIGDDWVEVSENKFEKVVSTGDGQGIPKSAADEVPGLQITGAASRNEDGGGSQNQKIVVDLDQLPFRTSDERERMKKRNNKLKRKLDVSFRKSLTDPDATDASFSHKGGDSQ